MATCNRRHRLSKSLWYETNKPREQPCAEKRQTHRHSNFNHEFEKLDARDVRVHVRAVLDQEFEQRHGEVAGRRVPVIDLVAQETQHRLGAGCRDGFQ